MNHSAFALTRRLWIAAGVLASALAAADARPPIAVLNPGFEADFASPNLFSIVVPQGWSVYDPNSIIDFANDAVGVLNPTGGTNFPAGAPEGVNVALIYLAQDVGGGPAGLSQTLSATLQPDTRYTLRVQVGNIASGFNAPPYDHIFFDLDGFPGYRVQLLAGGDVIAEDDNSLADEIPEGEFRLSVVAAEIGAAHPRLGQPIGIRLLNLNLPGTPEEPGIEVDFDDVRLDAEAIAPPCDGDADGNGTVNFADITNVLANFGMDYTPGSGSGDADGNGVVNFADITSVLANFSAACG